MTQNPGRPPNQLPDLSPYQRLRLRSILLRAGLRRLFPTPILFASSITIVALFLTIVLPARPLTIPVALGASAIMHVFLLLRLPFAFA